MLEMEIGRASCRERGWIWVLAGSPSPSLTVRVIVVEPNLLVGGLRATGRCDWMSEVCSFELGTRSGLDERPLTIKLSGGVSTSPMENGMAAVGVSSFVD